MNLNQIQQTAAFLNSGFTIDMTMVEKFRESLPTNRRERRAAQFGPVYKFRGLPCNIQPDENLWCVCGGMKGGGGGVLEWCYDEQDANDILKEMQKYSYFVGLHASAFFDKYNELKSGSRVEGESK